MGGLVPIGYDVIDRRLAVNQSEAETVREIFRRYAVRSKQPGERLVVPENISLSLRAQCWVQ